MEPGAAHQHAGRDAVNADPDLGDGLTVCDQPRHGVLEALLSIDFTGHHHVQQPNGAGTTEHCRRQKPGHQRG